MLKNSKCVINICCYAPKAYVHAQRTPLFSMVQSKQVANFTRTFECGKLQYKWWFFVYLGRLKVWICKIMAYEGWSIIHWCMNGVHEWDWVHERFLCPRAAPSGINNRSWTQSHSWTPNLKILTTLHCRPVVSVCSALEISLLTILHRVGTYHHRDIHIVSIIMFILYCGGDLWPPCHSGKSISPECIAGWGWSLF